jgi:hypothetical protein
MLGRDIRFRPQHLPWRLGTRPTSPLLSLCLSSSIYHLTRPLSSLCLSPSIHVAHTTEMSGVNN